MTSRIARAPMTNTLGHKRTETTHINTQARSA